MIEIQSKTLDKIKIQTNQIFHFPDGLFGFESYRHFALIQENQTSIFRWLQSIEEQQLAFLLISPFLFKNEYKPEITEEEIAKINLLQIENKDIFVIITIPNDNRLDNITANLQGPIILNREKLIGKQFISRSEDHFIRERIFQ